MKKGIILAFLAGAVCLTSCNSNDDDNNRVESPVKKEVLEANDAQLFNQELAKFKETAGFKKASAEVAIAAKINESYESSSPEHLVELFTDLAPYVGQAEQFKQWLQKSKENQTEVAVEGKAGYLGKRIVDARGVETFMLYKKGITGGLQIHNITEGIKSIKQGKDVQNNLNVVMGYLFGVDDFTLTTGKAGYLGKRIVDARGVETFMLYKKGITGGLQIHNITEGIKSIKQGKDVQNNLNVVMGYLFGVDDFTLTTGKEGKYKLVVNNDEKARPKNELLRYINQVSEKPNTPILANIVSAVNTASTNIKDPKKLNQSLDVISESVAKILALRAVHYFDEFVDDLSSEDKRVTAVHEMSEGLGFVYGLQFTYNPATGKPYFTNEEVLNYINSVNFWKADEAKEKLSKIANELAKRLKFNRKDA
ncbi:DUF4856 domain-containing protein [Ornithobacterium rhinotracheale]|uniref:DUF4856 domain-containing protein n=1 Tax=Ornithobacterium rhinotracheale TaxID=28251 RepID=UPI003FD6A8E5